MLPAPKHACEQFYMRLETICLPSTHISLSGAHTLISPRRQQREGMRPQLSSSGLQLFRGETAGGGRRHQMLLRLTRRVHQRRMSRE